MSERRPPPSDTSAGTLRPVDQHVSEHETPASSGAAPAGSSLGARFLGRFRRHRSDGGDFFLGLPGKLLVLTLLFVMLAEVLIFVPSIANYRVNWLSDRLTAGRLASLAVKAAPGGTIPQEIRLDLLASARVNAVAVKEREMRRLILPAYEPIVIDASFDLRPVTANGGGPDLGYRMMLIRDALYVFFAPRGRMLRAYGAPSRSSEPDSFVEVVIAEDDLRADMMRHALNILILSIIISVITAALVYIALSRVLVNPILRLARNMVRFAEAPEDRQRIIAPADRADEIGIAQRELAKMQTQLSQTLQQKNRLAELGLAVSKINHDLRNMLASAQLLSDRLGMIQDPTVQRFAPKLIASLDRAINFCNDTLKFGRAGEADPRRAVFDLSALVQEVADGLQLPRDTVDWQVDIPAALPVDADREHLSRVLNNVVKNAVDALELAKTDSARISVSAERTGARTEIRIADNGPGVPDKARRNMFKAFQGGARPGGTGLGLAIAAELVRAHGGEIRLLELDGDGRGTGNPGAVFEIVIPDRIVAG